MTSYAFDPDNWLVSTTRMLGSYVNDMVAARLPDDEIAVEMSFPNTREWEKEMPLAKPLIHFEQDHISDPRIGFGIPGIDVLTDPADGTYKFHEAAQHVLDFDVGVWVSAEQGGGTKRMQIVQALKSIFATAGGRQAFNEATNGLAVVSFEGGRNELDRINDVPIWRALDMTLIVRVFSRHIPAAKTGLTAKIDQGQNLTVVSEDGTAKPVVTP